VESAALRVLRPDAGQVLPRAASPGIRASARLCRGQPVKAPWRRALSLLALPLAALPPGVVPLAPGSARPGRGSEAPRAHLGAVQRRQAEKRGCPASGCGGQQTARTTQEVRGRADRASPPGWWRSRAPQRSAGAL